MNVIGIDVSQKTLDVCLLNGSGGCHHLKADNDASGFGVLLDWVRSHRIRKVVICMEATGIYYEKAADYLSRYYPVYVVNPLKIKDYARSQFSHTKTDKADAALIADYAKRHLDKLDQYQAPDDDSKRLHKLLALRHQLKCQLKQTKNRHHASGDDVYVSSVYERIIVLLEEEIAEAAVQIDALIKQHEELKQHYGHLQTIPSVGKETAALLLRHLSAKEFKTANNFVSFAGLSPKIEESGTSVKKKGKNRYGHKRLKQALFMPALVAYRLNAFPLLIRNLQQSGKPKMVIIGAIMRKLAKLAYYIHKTGKPYDKSRHQPI